MGAMCEMRCRIAGDWLSLRGVQVVRSLGGGNEISARKQPISPGEGVAKGDVSDTAAGATGDEGEG